MPQISRRNWIKLMGLSATASALPWYLNQAIASTTKADDYYQLPIKGQARILHITDVHGQLNPVYFREPNVNMGVGDALGRPPHIVGKQLLSKMGFNEKSPEAYAYTYLDFANAAKQYGRMGGFSHIKTLLNSLRQQAGGQQNTITLDGGDLWQGSGTSLWTRGVDMVEASNLLGIDVMVGHWEFTYKEQEVLSNIALFKGDFIGQNVRVIEDALMSDDYIKLTEQYDGKGLYDEDTGHTFQPYVMKEINGKLFAIVGQAFPRTGNANPREFFPDWSFGLREGDMATLVKKIHTEEKPDAVVLLSHNGMDVDIKMAENVPGFDAIFGGHTHDGMPQPIKVNNKSGNTCLVTNAGSNGKYVGVMDFDFSNNKKTLNYQMFPVFSEKLAADKEMDAYISQMRSKKYDKNIVESRLKSFYYNKNRVGKTFDDILNEKLAKADRLLYRRGNFMGTWDQVLCNALMDEYDADVAMSAGVRWGTSVLEGDWITMDDVMSQCALTYGETYVAEMTGKALLETLEQVADNLFDPDPYLQSGGDMVRVGGLDYTINPTKKIYQRITDARLDNGKKIEENKVYKVAGWATVNRTPTGRLMWDIVRDYIIKSKGKDDILKLAKINHPKVVGASSNPGFADYEGDWEK